MVSEPPVVNITTDSKDYEEAMDKTPSKPGKGNVASSSGGSSHLSNNDTGVRKRSGSRTSSGGKGNPKSSVDISPASMIFRNLLILEDDLRHQAHEQKVLKWQFSIFYLTLISIAICAIYELYFSYDDQGLGSREVESGFSRSLLQAVVIFICVTFVLFHLSGEYKRTIILPRKFFTLTNKGLRQFNLKLVKVESTMSDRVTDLIRYISHTVAIMHLHILLNWLKFNKNWGIVTFLSKVKVRSQPRIGATDVKIVLNPRAFTVEIREGWEIYRDEFWAREGARRRQETKKL